MSDVRVRAARGLIASAVRSAAKEARTLRRQAASERFKAEQAQERAKVIDTEATATEAEVAKIDTALDSLNQ